MPNTRQRTEARTERLAARVPAAVKAQIHRAAELTGRSVSDFVIASAQAAAEETIRRYEVVQLTTNDSQLLADALLNPPEPNAHLRAAFDDYRQFAGR